MFVRGGIESGPKSWKPQATYISISSLQSLHGKHVRFQSTHCISPTNTISTRLQSTCYLCPFVRPPPPSLVFLRRPGISSAAPLSVHINSFSRNPNLSFPKGKQKKYLCVTEYEESFSFFNITHKKKKSRHLSFCFHYF